MEQSQKNAMKCNFDGIMTGLKERMLQELEERPDNFNQAIQAMVTSGQVFDDEEITHQFNISYELILNNACRIVALSILDKDNIKANVGN